MATAETPSANLKLMLYSFAPEFFLPKDEAKQVYPLSSSFGYMLEETGYLHIQATKPDTVGKTLLMWKFKR